MGDLADQLGQLVKAIEEQMNRRDEELQEMIEELARLRDRRNAAGLLLAELRDGCMPEQIRVDRCVVIQPDEFDDETMADAAATVLHRANRRMHAREIWQHLLKGGYPNVSTHSFQSLVTCLNRSKSRFRNCSKNTFELVEPAGRDEGRYEDLRADEGALCAV